jgi:hypothetical protein
VVLVVAVLEIQEGEGSAGSDDDEAGDGYGSCVTEL